MPFKPLTRERLERAIGEGDELVTLAEAADELGVAPRTVRTWVQRGHVASTVAAGARCVLLSDAAFLERLTRDTTAPRRGRRREDRWA